MWHHYRQNKADNIEAQAHFQQALRIDAQYPQATAALSISLCSAAMIGWVEEIDAHFKNAYDLAQRAVALDPRYPNAHFAFGLACMYMRRSERGISAFEQAIRLNPSFAAAHVLLGQMYLYAGRRGEAIEQAEKGIRLSPSVRACSSGFPRWLGRTTRCGIMRRLSKPGDDRGHSTGIGRTAYAMLLPGWPSLRESRRRRRRLPSSRRWT